VQDGRGSARAYVAGDRQLKGSTDVCRATKTVDNEKASDSESLPITTLWYDTHSIGDSSSACLDYSKARETIAEIEFAGSDSVAVAVTGAVRVCGGNCVAVGCPSPLSVATSVSIGAFICDRFPDWSPICEGVRHGVCSSISTRSWSCSELVSYSRLAMAREAAVRSTLFDDECGAARGAWHKPVPECDSLWHPLFVHASVSEAFKKCANSWSS
jgi:hypothetical protein